MKGMVHFRIRSLITAVCLLPCAARGMLSQPALPAKARADSAKVPAPLFTTKDAVAATLFGIGLVAMFPLDERLAKHLTNPGAQANKFFKNASTGVEWIASPGAYVIGGSLYAVGRLGHFERIADLGWHGTEAVFVADAVTYALKGLNGDEIEPMLRWTAAAGHDLTLIETMPLGMIDEDRTDRYLPLDKVKASLAERFTMTPLAESSGGPARYFQVEELGARIGFITPLTHNFCESCNRVRLTAEGKLYMCLGQDDRVDLRAALRNGGSEALEAALDEAMRLKPQRHNFAIEKAGAAPAVARHMSVTGG